MDLEEIANIALRAEQKFAWGEVSVALSGLRDALLTQGFTREEAVDICKSTVIAMTFKGNSE
jgi:hypothetical protein